MDLDQILGHGLAAQWSPEIRAVYRTFCEHLMQREALTVKVGKGGLSFYKTIPAGAIFVCHFNAAPRGGSTDLGFADFRCDTLERVLDLPAAMTGLQSAFGPEIEIKTGNIWYSFHFPLARSSAIADTLREHVVSRIATVQPTG